MRWCECRHVGEGIDFANDVISKPEEKRRLFRLLRRGQWLGGFLRRNIWRGC